MLLTWEALQLAFMRSFERLHGELGKAIQSTGIVISSCFFSVFFLKEKQTINDVHHTTKIGEREIEHHRIDTSKAAETKAESTFSRVCCAE